MALPHVGNWDAAGPWLRSLGRPLVAVAEQLRPPRLYDLFVANRAAFGVEVIGLGDPGIARTLAGKLADGYIVALVADRDLTGRGVEVTMFGRKRRVPAGPALLSLTTGAPLIVTPVFQTERGWRCVMTPAARRSSRRAIGAPTSPPSRSAWPRSSSERSHRRRPTGTCSSRRWED